MLLGICTPGWVLQFFFVILLKIPLGFSAVSRNRKTEQLEITLGYGSL